MQLLTGPCLHLGEGLPLPELVLVIQLLDCPGPAGPETAGQLLQNFLHTVGFVPGLSQLDFGEDVATVLLHILHFVFAQVEPQGGLRLGQVQLFLQLVVDYALSLLVVNGQKLKALPEEGQRVLGVVLVVFQQLRQLVVGVLAVVLLEVLLFVMEVEIANFYPLGVWVLL